MIKHKDCVPYVLVERLSKECCNHRLIFLCLYHTYTILPKVLGHPLLMKGLTTLVISMSTNLNVSAYNDILGNCVLLIL